MFRLTLDLTNTEAAALYTQTQRQRDEIAKVLLRPADNTTEARTIAFNVLGRIAAALVEHQGVVATPGPRMKRCRKCGWPETVGHADGCPTSPQGATS